MRETLNQYGVNFSTPINYPLYNRITTINDCMSQFIGDYYTVNRANSLLNGVNTIVTNNDTIGGYMYTQSMQIATANSLETHIYEDMDAYENDKTISPSYSLPTLDFQVIVQAWRDYLVQSPTTKQV